MILMSRNGVPVLSQTIETIICANELCVEIESSGTFNRACIYFDRITLCPSEFPYILFQQESDRGCGTVADLLADLVGAEVAVEDVLNDERDLGVQDEAAGGHQVWRDHGQGLADGRDPVCYLSTGRDMGYSLRARMRILKLRVNAKEDIYYIHGA